MVGIALIIAAILLILTAVISMVRLKRLEREKQVNQRLMEIAFREPYVPVAPVQSRQWMSLLERWLRRVGIQLKPGVAIVLLVTVIMCGVLLLKTMGFLAAALWWSLVGTTSVVIPQIRYRQKINRLVSQVPLFIDQVIRGLATGRNVEGAIKLATEDLQEPLRTVMLRAQKNVDLGGDLGDALRDAAHFYDVRELHMLALAIHTSRVYGGSPREMLESIVKLIRQREQMQRELRAMTAETRISAWVLGVLPSAMGLYISFANPQYILSMWNDPSGQQTLLTALAFQAVGALVLWRMVKSV